MGFRVLEKGREWKLPGFLYAGNLVLPRRIGRGHEGKVMVRHFVEVSRTKGLKFNQDKRKVMALWCVLNELRTDGSD